MKKMLTPEQVRCLLIALEEELSSVEHQITSPTIEVESTLHVHEMRALDEKAAELRSLVALFEDLPDVWVLLDDGKTGNAGKAANTIGV